MLASIFPDSFQLLISINVLALLGEIVLEGTGRELLENDEVQRAYLG